MAVARAARARGAGGAPRFMRGLSASGVPAGLRGTWRGSWAVRPWRQGPASRTAGRGAPFAHYFTTTRPLSGWMGRFVFWPMVFSNVSIWALDAVTGVFNISQRTPSEHGGVVSDPL